MLIQLTGDYKNRLDGYYIIVTATAGQTTRREGNIFSISEDILSDIVWYFKDRGIKFKLCWDKTFGEKAFFWNYHE